MGNSKSQETMEYGLKHIDHLQVTDIDEDLVNLANSLFNSEEVADP